jgi:hypothetical protein
MRSRLHLVLAAALAFLLLRPAAAAPPSSEIWFAPAPGAIDYVDLFQRPEQWPAARELTGVFKFYQQHTLLPPASNVGPNSYNALAAAGAFRRVKEWGKKTAIEVSAVKPYYCTADASGMAASIEAALASIRAVEEAGGRVDFLAMDEPFASGRERVCGGPALEPTANRIAIYAAGVHAVYPQVAIGMVEAYPFSSAADIVAAIDLLRARGAAPAFLHADVDSRALRPGEFTRDMRALRAACAERGIPFGIIIWGYNGNADVLYAQDAARVTSEIAEAFHGWEDMPSHLIVQSWAVSNTGLSITPSNLPERAPYTHTNLLLQVYRRLLGQTGPSTGVAVRR